GLTGDAYDNAALFRAPYRHALLLCAGLHLGGGLLALCTVRNGRHAAAARPATAASLELSGCSPQPAATAPAADLAG
ncbi:MAG TPA: hypothetical protein VHO01_01350, partial [Jatrophihabitans sp.]|nr:hypothetical protein [Jatrophihabitans sp.]